MIILKYTINTFFNRSTSDSTLKTIWKPLEQQKCPSLSPNRIYSIQKINIGNSLPQVNVRQNTFPVPFVLLINPLLYKLYYIGLILHSASLAKGLIWTADTTFAVKGSNNWKSGCWNEHRSPQTCQIKPTPHLPSQVKAKREVQWQCQRHYCTSEYWATQEKQPLDFFLFRSVMREARSLWLKLWNYTPENWTQLLRTPLATLSVSLDVLKPS